MSLAKYILKISLIPNKYPIKINEKCSIEVINTPPPVLKFKNLSHMSGFPCFR